MEPDETNLLSDFNSSLVQASTGKRFANYLIDALTFYIVLVCIFFIWAVTATESFREFQYYVRDNTITIRLVSYLTYGFYMFLVEGIFKGRSLGKLITGTRAVNEDGTRIGVKQALLRSLSRLVPFEAFSALGNPSFPWHDSWTHTMVVNERSIPV
jgi:uncharacterized RDD family membrane protein YckC